MKKYFLEGRDLPVESPQEGFYIRILKDGEQEIRLWEIHAKTTLEPREEPSAWIGIIVAGEMEFWVGEKKKSLFPSDIFWVPAGMRYHFRAIGERTARAVLIRKTDK